MKEIKITIPDNLTPEAEAILIGKKLIQKALSGTGTSQDTKRIGDEVKIIYPDTMIKVIRVNEEKPVVLCTCSICNTEYQSDAAKYYFTNYGGNVRKLPVCSEACVSIVVNSFPGRTAAKKKDLKHFRYY